MRRRTPPGAYAPRNRPCLFAPRKMKDQLLHLQHRSLAARERAREPNRQNDQRDRARGAAEISSRAAPAGAATTEVWRRLAAGGPRAASCSWRCRSERSTTRPLGLEVIVLESSALVGTLKSEAGAERLLDLRADEQYPIGAPSLVETRAPGARSIWRSGREFNTPFVVNGRRFGRLRQARRRLGASSPAEPRTSDARGPSTTSTM